MTTNFKKENQSKIEEQQNKGSCGESGSSEVTLHWEGGKERMLQVQKCLIWFVSQKVYQSLLEKMAFKINLLTIALWEAHYEFERIIQI